MPILSDVPEMYNGADASALACITAKLAVEKCLTSKLEETRQMVQQKVGAPLAINKCAFLRSLSPPVPHLGH